MVNRSCALVFSRSLSLTCSMPSSTFGDLVARLLADGAAAELHGADLNTFAAFREEAIGNHLLRQVADDEFLVDLDLLGVFGITSETERLTATWADTLLGGKIDELLTDRQPGIIAPLGSVVLRLLAPFPLGMVGVVLGIVQVIGAILQRLGFGASAEEIGLELPLLTLELFDFLLQRGDAEQGIAVATLPISDLLAELEVLASQGLDFGTTRPLPGSSSRLGQSTPGRSRSNNRPVKPS